MGGDCDEEAGSACVPVNPYGGKPDRHLEGRVRNVDELVSERIIFIFGSRMPIGCLYSSPYLWKLLRKIGRAHV